MQLQLLYVVNHLIPGYLVVPKKKKKSRDTIYFIYFILLCFSQPINGITSLGSVRGLGLLLSSNYDIKRLTIPAESCKQFSLCENY